MANIIGDNFNNLITGTDNDDLIQGLGGNDTLEGLGGNDTLDGGEGRDNINGGDGNDLIINMFGTVDGGEGNDTLNADFTNVDGTDDSNIGRGNLGISNSINRIITIFGTNSILDFSNIENLNLLGTAFNDNFTIFRPGYKLDGGGGNDTLNVSLSTATDNIIIDLTQRENQFIDSAETEVKNFESLGIVDIGSGNDLINIGSSLYETINSGGGDDIVNIGNENGIDSGTINGGDGNDTLNANFTDLDRTDNMNIGRGNLGITNEINRVITRFGSNSILSLNNIENFNLLGTVFNDDLRGFANNDTLGGGAGNDTVNGNDGDDILTGVNPNSHTAGRGEIDIATGGSGRDIFLLGNTSLAFYDDGNNTSNGNNDYLQITDFTLGEDKIQLHGSPSNYRLEISPFTASDTAIYLIKPGIEPDELIAVFQRINNTDININDSDTFFPAEEDPIDQNQPPTAISFDNNTIDENQPINTSVGRFITTDPDTGDTFTYRLVSGQGDTDNNRFTINANTLQSNEVFDFETQDTYSIRVETTDSGGLTFEQELIININNVNEPPTLITLDSNSVEENADIGTTIGIFTSTDSDPGDTFIYSLVTGEGDTDNNRFTINGNTLQTNQVFNFEIRDTYNIRVEARDSANNSYSQSLNIMIIDIDDEEQINFDIDGNGSLESSDYTLINLYASFGNDAGLFDIFLANNADVLLGQGATRTTGDLLTNYLMLAENSLFDLDGNGRVETSDYTLLDLYGSFGSDAQLLDIFLQQNGDVLLGEGATRTTGNDIVDYLDPIAMR